MAATNSQFRLPTRGVRNVCRPRPCGGFTLVEIMVVVGIIVVLVGILAPAILKAYNNARRAKIQADLNAIAMAIEAYKQDHGDIPRVMPAVPRTVPNAAELGSTVLCWALIAPLDRDFDGNAGEGFRVRPAVLGVEQGKKFGPYLNTDQFKYTFTNSTSAQYVQDRNKQQILYFPGHKTAPIGTAGGYVSAFTYNSVNTAVRPMFNTNDNDLSVFANDTANTGPNKFSVILGADPATGAALEAQVTGEFLLVSAGVDEKFGFPGAGVTDPTLFPNARRLCDDVTYPPR